MKSMKRIVILVAALLAAPGALAGDSKQGASGGDASKAAPAPQSSGKVAPRMVVTRDRETGQLRPATAEERAALAATAGRRVLGRTGEATVVETLPSGRKHARLGPEYIHWSHARVNADGTVSYDGVPAKKPQAGAAAPEK
ncbi:MAG: post-PEP-CTERM-1 domain-containing protein [Acidithiobacillales bacterium]